VGVAGPAKPAADDSDVGMSVYFARGGSALSDRARSLLEEVAGVLSRNRNLFLRLDGFTDRRSEGYNFKLSKQRCNAVRMFFVVRGIDPARISVNTVGWLVPAGGAAPRPGAKRTWKNDRRVQITLLEE
jgi:outer membrane protein OmpA-like peptidoglycan-associated protein